MKKLLITGLLCIFSIIIFGQTKKLDDIWKTIEQNDFKTAISLLETELKKNKSDNDLLSTFLLVADLDSEPFTHGDKFVQLCKNNPAHNEAIFSLYNQNSACANENFTKEFTLLANSALIQNKSVNFINRSIAIDHKANYFQNKMMADSMEASIAELPGIRKWSLVGPFEDDFNSAYNKSNDAQKFIAANHEFINEDGVKLKWYEPGKFDNYPWITKMKHLDENENVVFAQSFIEISKDGIYKIGLGYSGNLKVWIDDHLMHVEKETRVTDVANFLYKANLSAGTHRVLVQFGSYTANVPAFIVSIYDENDQALNISSKAFATNYNKSTIKIEEIKHFAEKLFEEKVAQNSSSIYYSLLLAKSYMRSYKITESLKVLHSIEEKYPNCGLIHFYLLTAYRSDNNDTKATKYENEFKKIFPNLYQTLSSRYSEEIANTNKEKAIAILDTIIQMYPNLSINHYNKIARLGLKEEYIKMVDEIKSVYKKRSDERGIVDLMANVVKNMDGDEKESLKIKEEFLKNNFDFAYYNELKNHYKKNNEKEKYLNLINSYDRIMPFNPSFKSDLISFYFNKKEFEKSKEVIDELLTYRPYVSSLYREIGDLYFNTEEKDKAIIYYEKASNLKPNSYYLKNKIYNLKYKKELVNEIAMIDPDQAIKDFKKKTVKEEGHEYVIIFNENVYIRPGGGGVMNLVQYMIELKNQKALDDWQRIDFSGGGFTNIEKAQVIKKNGTKIEAERHGNEVVFTNMEIGDYLYVKYNEEITTSGKISKFWDEQYAFNGSRPTLLSKYQILIDKNEPYQIKLINNNLIPTKTTVNNFDKIVYEVRDSPLIKEEPYSNGYDSILQSIVISSKSNWGDIVKWYEDISDEQSNAEFDADLLIREIFKSDISTYTEKEKAEKIFNYIVKNVQYSSISFRQSGIIPQRASDVYHTKIGDCKDMSNLYKAIARTVGLKSNLVLISTYDNGKNSVVSPSLNFNHCIVKVDVDNKPYYLELTDPSLNFGTLDYYHQNANILEIDSKMKSELTLLKSDTQNESKIVKQSRVEIKEGNKIVVNSKFTGLGKRAAMYRSNFKDSQDDTKKETIIGMISSSYENSINLKDYKLYNIDTTLNDASIEINYEVDKAIFKIGSLYSFKLPFSDLIFDPNTFAENDRKYGFDFNQYENTNTYEEGFNIILKNNLIFESIPDNINLKYEEMEYNLSFKKLSDKEMNVKRTFKSTKKIIGPEKFVELKEFVNNILEAENTNLALKL